MEDILEIRWHGRGGQGAKTAAQLLAEAAMDSGDYIQAFPEYGPERAGAPIKAFTRISEKPIKIHSGVKSPDIVVVIDPTLLESMDVTEGIKNGLLLVNTKESSERIREKLDFKDGKIGTVDATWIALDTLGLPMPNLPMLGALLKVNPLVDLNVLKKKIRKKFTKKIGKKKTDANVKGVKRAHEEVSI